MLLKPQGLSDKVEGTTLFSKHLQVWLLKSEVIQTLSKISFNFKKFYLLVWVFCLHFVYALHMSSENQMRALNPLC